MAWKPKEKTLSKEEALSLARQQLAPYWFGSPPLIGGARKKGVSHVFPLDDNFFSKSWLMFFVDPTTFTGETAFRYATEWKKRYQAFNFDVLVIFCSNYSYFSDPIILKRLYEKTNFPFPVVIDFDHTLASSFDISILPTIVLHNESKIMIRETGVDSLSGLELEIQKYLRKEDPGLSLLPVFQPKGEDMPIEISHIDFGTKGNYQIVESDLLPNDLQNQEVWMEGKWNSDEFCIWTEDKSASISFYSEGNRLAIVAASRTRTIESARIMIETAGIPAYDAFAADDLSWDDQGRSYIEVKEGQLYHSLQNLSPDYKVITLRCPSAKKVPISLYGIRSA